MNPLRELRRYLGIFSDRCRQAGWFGALFHVGVIADIEGDVEANERRQRERAHQAEILTAEAQRAYEAGDRERTNRLLHRIQELDHDITEGLA